MARILSDYNAKRDFKVTAEPRGKLGKNTSKTRRFVIQRHAATRLHFDLRLEHDGVYKSWAVTKVPSPDPAVKRLAVEVEDHPLEYGSFEGLIPKGEYGGGTVQLWDRGSFIPQGDVDEGLKKGNLKFALDGMRMQGGWALIRLRDKDKSPGRKVRHNWLLIKEKDDAARPGEEDALAKEVTSIKTGRTLAEIAEKRQPKKIQKTIIQNQKQSKKNQKTPLVATSARTNKAKKAARGIPEFVSPQLCTLKETPPSSAGWVHEVKFDGYRMQARVVDGHAQLLTRKGLDWTARFSEIAKECAAFPDCLLDGEICALDQAGMTDFGGLQTALSTKKTGGLIFFLFDCLFAGGVDLRPLPLEQRKKHLEQFLDAHAGKSQRLRFVTHFESSGEAVLHAACRMELEGVVSKKLDAPYTSGRGEAWTKSKCRGGQEVVVLGWRGDKKNLRSLLVGTHDKGKLIFRGRVGTGYTAKVAGDVLAQLMPLERKTPVVKGDYPRAPDLHWVEPKLVAEIAYENITPDGMFRQAAFKGLRLDKPAADIVLERARQPSPRLRLAGRTQNAHTPMKKSDDKPVVQGITISHPDKELWPKTKDGPAVTKLMLAQYYDAVADRMLPHIAERPITVVRAPDGIKGELFYQRHKLIGTAAQMQPIKAKGTSDPFLALDNKKSLVALAQAGVVEIHPWGAKRGCPELAERIIMDLDPAPDVRFSRVVEAALGLRKFLSALGLVPFVKTTGGKGLHVVVAVKPAEWSEVKSFAKNVALALQTADPSRYTTTISKKARTGKIFVDYLRNDRTSTGVAPYSPRARDGAPVAVPIEWKDVKPGLDPMQFTVAVAAKWMKRSEAWKDLAKSAKALGPAAKKLAALSKKG